MENTENNDDIPEKKELIIIPEPNQESINETFNDLRLILKSVLLIVIIMLTITLIVGIL